ncbi:anthranilate synthase component I family protein [Cyclobacterium jeungdonense]|uniref:Anthranilate synthase component I family protein n=1 Tax=Cyclobacterium jeungdonense TaxID=708087 RepID=A0ABT8C952_9BACT|nr:anthranilate synthase component I family protein [Cyclobacterium jeungdonense]MDN3689320.1 anthranilate synthase component I family protein [Cyclobacterium jeungdonense]
MPDIESTIIIPLRPNWIEQMLVWGRQQFNYFGYFHSNDIPYPQGGFEHVFYAGNRAEPLEKMSELPEDKPKIGIIGYDQKNKYEKLSSHNRTWFDCPDSVFFSPEVVIQLAEDLVQITAIRPDKIVESIQSTVVSAQQFGKGLTMQVSHDQQAYSKIFSQIRKHILEGTIYELNFCMDYHGTLPANEPERVFLELCSQSPMPFSAFFKAKDLFLCCASPERFLKKNAQNLLSQPIKGSVKRGSNPEADALLVKSLAESEKEKAENLMIVDLMRNDLSRVAEIGSVKVTELFGIYSFQRITQMISSISCRLKNGVTFEEIISKTFPMGSMTGAPKIKCMELIETYESFKRSWFSGTLGYINSSGDFDFCVVIRSLVINQTKNSFYFGVGSAITLDANATDEYQECQLKAAPIIQTLKKLYQSNPIL